MVINVGLCPIGTNADRILVSNIVRDLSVGQEIGFIARGEAELKGFDKPEPIHEVCWA